jgi:hypothetical protein
MTKTTFEQPEPDPRRRFDPQAWEALGISRHDGERWWKHLIEPADALAWRHAGVTEPLEAVRWKIAGVDPSTVHSWAKADIDAREAVVWSELGFDAARTHAHKRAGRSPVQAHRHDQGTEHVRMVSGPAQATPPAGGSHGRHRFIEAMRQGRQGLAGHLMHSYIMRHWFDDEAIAWASHGIEAGDALAWKELGLTPIEAERQQDQGNNAMQTAKAWWRAGIPVDEVADWIGAGLTPEEAAEQRAKGVTGERVAVLRSLRKDKDAGS